MAKTKADDLDLGVGDPPAGLDPVACQVWQRIAREAFWLSRVDRVALAAFTEAVARWRLLQEALDARPGSFWRRQFGWQQRQAEDELREGVRVLSLLALNRWREEGPGEAGAAVFVAWALHD